MKKIFITLFLISVTCISFAKKVRFACDMTGIIINTTGMHISGDFQTAAGFAGGDWNSASTSLTQEGSSDVYSIIVDIPAFNKYEYKFVNGDLFYEVEFVPEPSRVGYNFNDNRWIYIDSLANDTTDFGTLLFGQNAPAGMSMVRFFVDMANESASPNGIHLAGSFQGFDPATTFMYSFGTYNTNGPDIYEVISYMPTGTYEYKFFNGNAGGTEEIVPGSCAVNGSREITISGDTLVNLVCFGSCVPCVLGIHEMAVSQNINIAPNPAADHVIISWNEVRENISIDVMDVTGRIVLQYSSLQDNKLLIEKGYLDSGIYFIRLRNGNMVQPVAKLIFE